nr:uncharacterized protein CI109_005076 [Kwoniella shandongensis]KAA5526504.1 hypothetical protein CI109_005076 [Kwoniella shandongensis]
MSPVMFDHNDTASVDAAPLQTPTSSTTLRRGTIACRRCRRLRSKCLNDNGDGVPPCRGCRSAGKAEECIFVRGNSVVDRRDRPRPRKRSRHSDTNSTGKDGSNDAPTTHATIHATIHDLAHEPGNFDPFLSNNQVGPTELLSSPSTQQRRSPPRGVILPQPEPASSFDHYASARQTHESPLQSNTSTGILYMNKRDRAGDNRIDEQEAADGDSGPNDDINTLGLMQEELEEAAEIYFSSFYQVGFLHRASFLRRIKNAPNSISPFLVYAILSLTAGASNSLVQRRGGTAEEARRHYKDKAMLMLAEQCLMPSLECIQALYLLGLNDWGTGCGPRSWMLIGMGLRMAELLRLERSETYKGIQSSSSETEQITAESSRRTVWSLLIADDSLAVGFGSASTPKLEVTIQTPCDEDDWEFGSIPTHMSPESASRSLMGNTLSVMSLWSRAARWAAATQRGQSISAPWEPNSEFLEIDRQCLDFISGLSNRLKFSSGVLAVHRHRRTDMALTHLHLMYHGAHILLRRMHLPNMLAYLDPQTTYGQSPIATRKSTVPPPDFWRRHAETACRSASEVISMSLEYLAGRKGITPRGFTPLMCFVLFLAGTMMCYLVRWPSLCPELAHEAESKIISALNLLSELERDISVAGRWHSVLGHLHQAVTNPESSGDIAAEEEGVMLSTTSEDIGQSDPLGVLAGLAVSRPFSSTTNLSRQSSQYSHPVENGVSDTDMGQMQTHVFNLDMFGTFDLSTSDLATALGFSQVDFSGI